VPCTCDTQQLIEDVGGNRLNPRLDLTDSGIVHKLSIRWNPDDTANDQSNPCFEDAHVARRQRPPHFTLRLGGSRACGFRLLELSSAFGFVPTITGETGLARLAVIGRDIVATLLRT
jgi:hypothetical protein